MLGLINRKLFPFKRYAHKFFYVLDASARKGLLPIVFSFLFLSMLDLIGLSLVGPFVALATKGDAIAQLPGGQFISDLLGAGSHTELITLLGLIIVGVFIIKSVSGFYVNREIVRFALRHQKDIKLRLLNAYISLPLQTALEKNSSELLTTVHQHVLIFTNRVMIPLLRAASELVFFFFLFLFLFINNPFVTLLLGLVFLMMGVFYDAVVKKRIALSGQESVAAVRSSTKLISQAADGFKEIRVAGSEAFFESELDRHSTRYMNATIYSQSLAVLPKYMIEASVVSFVVIFLVVGLKIYGGASPELMSTVGVFAFAALRAMPSVNALLAAGNNLRFGRAALFELTEDLREAAEFNAQRESERRRKAAAPVVPLTFDTALCADAVSYRYPGKDEPALQDITLCIEKGASVGIIGSSGSGKTTLIDLLLGLLQPEQGEISVDGRSIHANARSWMDKIAYIPQSVFLLDDTIEANVAFGVPHDRLDRQRVAESLQVAQLKDMVDTLPDGDQTMVGERGVRLSGGQRQRIALARAFYEQRELLVMDEATAALDTETEKAVVEALKAFRGNLTIIVIAHRLATLKYCDRVYALEKGRLQRSGSYREIVGDGVV